jgi:ribosomal protein L2
MITKKPRQVTDSVRCYRLLFIARDGKSAQTVKTLAQGRNADGRMTYERPSDCFNRACRLIDLKKYKYDRYEELQSDVFNPAYC